MNPRDLAKTDSLPLPRAAFRAALALALALAASPAFASDGSLLGTLSGAALGGFVGSQFGRGTGQLAATGAGVLIGGALGNNIGSAMDRPSYGGGYGGSYSYYSTAPSYYGYSTPTYVAPPTYVEAPRQVIYVTPAPQPPMTIIEYRETVPAYVQSGYVGASNAVPVTSPRRTCREFTQNIKIDGKTQASHGTACLEPDGTWKIQP